MLQEVESIMYIIKEIKRRKKNKKQNKTLVKIEFKKFVIQF